MPFVTKIAHIGRTPSKFEWTPSLQGLLQASRNSCKLAESSGFQELLRACRNSCTYSNLFARMRTCLRSRPLDHMARMHATGVRSIMDEDDDLTVEVLFQVDQSRKPLLLDLALGEQALTPNFEVELKKIDKTIYLPLIRDKSGARDCASSGVGDTLPFILQR